jgi:hypothetical protein
MREICTSGSVRGGGGNVPTYLAERQRDRAIRTIQSQPLEAIIAVNLKHAGERRQVPGRAAALAVLSVDIGGDRVGRSGPWPIVDRVARRHATG